MKNRVGQKNRNFFFFRKRFSAKKLPVVIRKKNGMKKLKSVNIFRSRIELEAYEKLQKSRYFKKFLLVKLFKINTL